MPGRRTPRPSAAQQSGNHRNTLFHKGLDGQSSVPAPSERIDENGLGRPVREDVPAVKFAREVFTPSSNALGRLEHTPIRGSETLYYYDHSEKAVFKLHFDHNSSWYSTSVYGTDFLWNGDWSYLWFRSSAINLRYINPGVSLSAGDRIIVHYAYHYSDESLVENKTIVDGYDNPFQLTFQTALGHPDKFENEGDLNTDIEVTPSGSLRDFWTTSDWCYANLMPGASLRPDVPMPTYLTKGTYDASEGREWDQVGRTYFYFRFRWHRNEAPVVPTPVAKIYANSGTDSWLFAQLKIDNTGFTWQPFISPETPDPPTRVWTVPEQYSIYHIEIRANVFAPSFDPLTGDREYKDYYYSGLIVGNGSSGYVGAPDFVRDIDSFSWDLTNEMPARMEWYYLSQVNYSAD